MDTENPTISRRRALATIGTATGLAAISAAVAVPAFAADADAELIALARKFDEILPTAVEAWHAVEAAEEDFNRSFAPFAELLREKHPMIYAEVFVRKRKAHPVEEAINRHCDLDDEMIAIAWKAAELTPTTPAGLAAQVRVMVLHGLKYPELEWYLADGRDFEALDDAYAEMKFRTIAAVERFAGIA